MTLVEFAQYNGSSLKVNRPHMLIVQYLQVP